MYLGANKLKEINIKIVPSITELISNLDFKNILAVKGFI